MRNLWIFVLWRSIETEFSVDFLLWSVENGVLKTEIQRSVCVNLRCILNFFGFFAFQRKLKMTMRSFFFVLTLCVQNDKGVPSLCYKNAFYSSLRAVFTETAWQSINLNANLPLDCHEFARFRFANSRNDEFLVILRRQPKYP